MSDVFKRQVREVFKGLVREVFERLVREVFERLVREVFKGLVREDTHQGGGLRKMALRKLRSKATPPKMVKRLAASA